MINFDPAALKADLEKAKQFIGAFDPVVIGARLTAFEVKVKDLEARFNSMFETLLKIEQYIAPLVKQVSNEVAGVGATQSQAQNPLAGAGAQTAADPTLQAQNSAVESQ